MSAKHTKRYLTAKINKWSLLDLDRVVTVRSVTDLCEEALADIEDINPHARRLLRYYSDEQFERFISQVIKNL